MEQLRRLTKQIQDARIARDNDAIKRAINEYDEALEAYIPGLMVRGLGWGGRGCGGLGCGGREEGRVDGLCEGGLCARGIVRWGGLVRLAGGAVEQADPAGCRKVFFTLPSWLLAP